MVTLVAMLVAAPIGLASAIYLAEYAAPRCDAWSSRSWRSSPASRSVVLGFFAITVHQPRARPGALPAAPAFNILAAGLGVGILIDPARRVDRRGRHAGRARRRCARRRTGWAPGASRRACGSCSRPRSRASSRRSSWPPAARSARRWSWPSPRAPPAAACAASTLEPGQTMTGGHGLAGDRQRPGRGARRRVPEPVLRRARCCSSSRSSSTSLGDAFVRRTRQRY